MNSFRPAASLLVCMGMIACSSPRKPVQHTNPTSGKLKGWYVATKEPLTFCPRGYSLPQDRSDVYQGEYVYLGDRKTRFYIPSGCLLHRQQALELRALSKPENYRADRQPMTVENTIRWVSKAICRTSVTGIALAACMFGGAFGGAAPSADGALAQMMDAVWDD